MFGVCFFMKLTVIKRSLMLNISISSASLVRASETTGLYVVKIIIHLKCQC